MTPDERIDAALDSVLKASGSTLKHYSMPATLEKMRAAMRKIMSAEFILGTHANLNAMEHAKKIHGVRK